jgi:hypothetical protein
LTRTAGQGYEIEPMRALALVFALALAGAAAPGPSVTLNGVNIDGVRNQKFENCTVVVDGKGDIHIEAKGYAVKATETVETVRRTSPETSSRTTAGRTQQTATNALPPSGKRLSRRYFLATEHTPPGTQYDLAIFINAQWIREVKGSERQVVMEITKYLRPGANKVTLAASKRISGDRLAYGRDVVLKVVVGEGNIGGDHVMIDVPLIETQRTAAEIDDKTEEFVIEAR